MMDLNRWLASVAVLMMVGVMVAGCTPAGVKMAKVGAFEDLPEAEGEVDSDAQFLFELAEKKQCTSDDAYRGMLYFLDKSDTSKDFQERTARLVMHGVVDKKWKHNPSEVVNTGKVAYMFARALEIRGGVMYNITNAGPRYALRELLYKDIIRGGSEYSKVSGAEFVGIMGRADDYRREHGR